MYRTIVAGCDGSEHGLAAARFAGALARRLDAQLVITSAFVHTPHVRVDATALEELARAEADAAVRQGLAAAGSGVEARTLIVSDTTLAKALHEAARVEGADLLVVGASKRRRVAGTQPGSVTERVLHHSPCAVAVVPQTDGDPGFRRIGVAIDAGAPARAALDRALGLARRLAGDVEEIVVLHAAVPDVVFLRPGMEMPAAPSDETPGWLQEVADRADAPVPLRVVTQVGAAAGMLTSRAADLDLLVMGSSDKGPLRRLVLGSVSSHVVRHAPCPVIVEFAPAARSAAEPDPADVETAT